MAVARVVVIVLAVIVLVASAGVWWAVGTRSGARWTFERLGAGLPGELRVEDLSGSIRGPLRVRGLHYQAEGYELTVADLSLDWSLRHLVRQRIEVGSLRADSVTVRFKTRGEAAREERQKGLPDVDLPLDILIRNARITNLAFYQPGTEEPFGVDTLVLELAIGDTLGVRQLAVRSDRLDLTLRGYTLTRGAYPVSLDARWRVRPSEGEVWSGAGSIAGSLDTLLLEQRVTRPFVGDIEARLFEPLRDLRFDGLVEFSRFSLRELDPGLPAGTWRGTVRGRGTPAAFTSTGEVASRQSDWGPLDAVYRIRRAGERWVIERLDVSVPGGPTRLSATGEVTDAMRLDLETRWTDLTWPTTGGADWSSPSGTARLTGTAERYRVVANAELEVPRALVGRARFEGTGDANAIDLARFEAAVGEGRVTGSGRVAWSPRVSWDLSAVGSGFPTAPLTPDWPGSVGFSARSSGRIAGDVPSGNVVLERLDGEMRGRPIEASGAVSFRGGRYDVESATATWGQARFRAAGAAGERWDLAWSFDVPNLALVAADAGGQLQGQGWITGPERAMRIESELAGDSLAWGEFRVRRLAVDADLEPTRDLQLDLVARDLHFREYGIDSLGLESRGPRRNQRLTAWVQARNDRLDLDLGIAGSTTGPGWTGRLVRLELDSRAAGLWNLAAPADLTAVNGEIRMSDFCWTSGSARLCTQLGWGPRGAWTVDADLDDLPLSLLRPLLPPKMVVVGPLAGAVRAHANPQGALVADVDLSPGPGEIRYLAGADSARLRFDRASLRAESGSAGLSIAGDLRFPGTGALEARLELPGFDLHREPREQRLSGQLVANFDDLGVAQALLPGVEGTRGSLRADLSLGGTIAAPLATGNVDLTQGRAVLAEPGIELREVELHAQRDDAGQATFRGSARSGPGRVQLEGRARLAGEEALLRATLTGSRFQAMNTQDIELLVSPDVAVEVTGRRIELTGQVEVPRAEIQRIAEGEQVVRPAEDVIVIEGSEALRRDPGLQLDARVRLVLGDDVHLEALGLDARLGGSVLILESTGRPTRATGELRVVRGTYRAYGQDLSIERGRLLFGGGPITNPSIDLRATRTASDGVVAGFEARGTLREPILSVFSTPSMGESQALSYVLFGRPLDRVGAGEGALATRIATALEVPGGNLLLDRVTSQMGLEEARITSAGGLREASVVLGKFLSPRLYVHYGFGLFDAASTLRLRYTLNRLWSLAAEVAREENRAQIQYTTDW